MCFCTERVPGYAFFCSEKVLDQMCFRSGWREWKQNKSTGFNFVVVGLGQ